MAGLTQTWWKRFNPILSYHPVWCVFFFEETLFDFLVHHLIVCFQYTALLTHSEFLGRWFFCNKWQWLWQQSSGVWFRRLGLDTSVCLAEKETLTIQCLQDCLLPLPSCTHWNLNTWEKFHPRLNSPEYSPSTHTHTQHCECYCSVLVQCVETLTKHQVKPSPVKTEL